MRGRVHEGGSAYTGHAAYSTPAHSIMFQLNHGPAMQVLASVCMRNRLDTAHDDDECNVHCICNLRFVLTKAAAR